MRSQPVFVALLASLIVSACDASIGNMSGSSRAGAEFRIIAQDMYASLHMPSCEAPDDFDRRDRLEKELLAVADFEAANKAGPALSHLRIAFDDALHRIKAEERCWHDPSPQWAKDHLDMTRENVRTALPKLEALSPGVPRLADTIATGPELAAEFRFLVRRLLSATDPACRIVASAPNEEILQASSELESKFESDLEGTVFEKQFDIAEADELYERSITSIECGTPVPGDPEAVSAVRAESVRTQIAALMAIVEAG